MHFDACTPYFLGANKIESSQGLIDINLIYIQYQVDVNIILISTWMFKHSLLTYTTLVALLHRCVPVFLHQQGTGSAKNTGISASFSPKSLIP